jgi:hypothetical protein
VWARQAYVKASNTDAHDYFGRSVALSSDGSILAVGAPGEGSHSAGMNGNQADNSAEEAGAVYLFSRQGSVWRQKDYMKVSNPKAGDGFGWDIGLSADGRTMAVAAAEEGSENVVASSYVIGAVYLFHHLHDKWNQQAYIKVPVAESGGFFGSTIALSGNGATLAISAPHRDPMEASKDPSKNEIPVHVFSRAGDRWKRQTFVKAANTQAGDWFGGSLALSDDGNVLAVGASGEDSKATGIDGDQTDNSTEDAGATYVFIRRNGAWHQRSYVKAPNTGLDDEFGHAVALSGDGNTLAIGAPHESSKATGINGDMTDNSAPWSGAVYVY